MVDWFGDEQLIQTQGKTHINTSTVHYMYGAVYTYAMEKARDCVMRSTVPVC